MKRKKNIREKMIDVNKIWVNSKDLQWKIENSIYLLNI